jgi:hypothetical protein
LPVTERIASRMMSTTTVGAVTLGVRSYLRQPLPRRRRIQARYRVVCATQIRATRGVRPEVGWRILREKRSAIFAVGLGCAVGPLFVVPALYLLMATDHSHTGKVARSFAEVS